jgi:hypothetical protein
MPLAAIVCLAVTVATLGAWADDKGTQRLRVRSTASNALLQVAITGPRSFVGWADAMARETGTCTRTFGLFAWEAFKVDWGDGPGGAMDWIQLKNSHTCPQKLTHTYAKPGVYTIRAIRTHSGPRDGTTIGWRGEATVTVRP